jgi:hypothetical protein
MPNTEPQYDPEQIRAYNALKKVAETIGMNHFRSGRYKVTGKGKNRKSYTITDTHKSVVDAMPKVLDGSMSVEEAFALILSPEVEQERFPK